MKCPMTMNNITRGRVLFRLVPSDCLQAECAIWDEHLEGCSVKWIQRGIYDLVAALDTYIHNTTGGG